MKFLTLMLCLAAAASHSDGLKQLYSGIPYDEDLSRHCALLSSVAYGLDSQVRIQDVFLNQRELAVATFDPAIYMLPVDALSMLDS
jgi:hypothetical protein